MILCARSDFLPPLLLTRRLETPGQSVRGLNSPCSERPASARGESLLHLAASRSNILRASGPQICTASPCRSSKLQKPGEFVRFLEALPVLLPAGGVGGRAKSGRSALRPVLLDDRILHGQMAVDESSESVSARARPFQIDDELADGLVTVLGIMRPSCGRGFFQRIGQAPDHHAGRRVDAEPFFSTISSEDLAGEDFADLRRRR